MTDDWNPGLSVAERTDVGMRRSNNQDSHAAVVADSPDRFAQRGHLFVVADGMGAHAAGELASQMATETITSTYFKSPSSSSEPTDLVTLLQQSIEQANASIHLRGQQNPEFHNMGTTASALAITPTGAIVAHVGDSRVYRMRGKSFEQLTFDHSLVWEMEASGQVHPDSALGQSIPKNVITRSLGPGASVQVDCEGPFPVQAGDVFLLCSDGLSGQVEDQEIGAILASMPEQEAARVLIDLANLRGGPDNSTVLIIRVDDVNQSETASQGKTSAASTHQVVSRLVPVTVVLCLVGAIVLGLMGKYQTMVIAILLGLAAVITGLVQSRLTGKPAPAATPRSQRGGGKGPYRRCSSEPTSSLHGKLSSTVNELKQVADQRHWELDWSSVDAHAKAAAEAVEKEEFRSAVFHQARAIIETMQQLRDQHNRAANDTQIE